MQELEYKKEDHPIDFAEFDAEAEKAAIGVNNIIRFNGSSAFPMPRSKKKTAGIIVRIGRMFKP
jgi:hypothetical protein